MVSDERYVEKNCEPFPSKQEEKVDEDVEEVLREDQWIQAVTLVNWVLVICLQFIKRYNLKSNSIYFLSLHLRYQSKINLLSDLNFDADSLHKKLLELCVDG